MGKKRFAVLVSVLGVIVASLATAAVGTANHRWDVDIRVSNDRPALHGVLSSRAESCESGRYVWVERVRRGPNKFVGDDSSSLRGAWSVDVNRSGVYVVHVDGYGVCGGDKVRVRF